MDKKEALHRSEDVQDSHGNLNSFIRDKIVWADLEKPCLNCWAAEHYGSLVNDLCNFFVRHFRSSFILRCFVLNQVIIHVTVGLLFRGGME
ncbi:hypothetical protein TNCV_2939721 [Trichonephila clavipes]|nr:hypothetical protein TNCV_2939721 [Trichonephila clavipes]